MRINAVGSSFHAEDRALVSALDLDAVVLPKATPAAVDSLGADGPPLVAIVESAEGVRLAYELASRPRVVALQIGAVDLGAEIGLEPRADGLELLYVRSKLVLDAAAAGIRSPFDVVHLDVRGGEALEAECRTARSLGFRGKACIHPAQVPVVNAAFSARHEEIAWARKVLAAYDQAVAEGRGVLSVDGEMVDLPVVTRAQRVLAEADRR